MRRFFSEMLGRFAPAGKVHLDDGEREFMRALSVLARDPSRSLEPGSPLIGDLVRLWANEGWSALHEYARAVVAESLAARGPILECGSGLTTLLLGVVSQGTGRTVLSLESSRDWGAKTERLLRAAGIESVSLHHASLVPHGESDWYSLPKTGVPDAFHLVVCDGPPGDTRGGRAGLMGAVRARLAPGCVILLDDAGREHERALGLRWRDELGAECKLCGTEKPYYRIVLPG